MKKQFSLLAICLCGIGLANAQTTTPTYSATSTPTNSSYSSSMATDSTRSMNNSNSMNSNSSTTNGTYSTNSMATDGTTTTTSTETYSTTDRPARTKANDYKNFVFGIYAGLNSTKFKGESVNTGGDISGRIGYQAGFFVRGGGRLFGQIGGEYFASSSNYFTKGDGQSAASIQDQINIQYVQIPLYIGYKLLQSDRGLSAIRLQAGLEYANRISSSSGKFNLTNAEIKSGTFNALAQLGFDIGPLLIDLTYHHGLSDSIKNPTNGSTTTTGFAGSQRRILSASVGFKF
jgi:hypothetical protein